MITYEGKTMCASDWAKETGISASAIRYRFKRGWGTERIFSTIPRPFNKPYEAKENE